MKKNKIIKPLIIVISVLVLASVLFGFPFKLALFYSAPQLCSVTPHASNCFCSEGEERISGTISSGTFYNCEPLIKAINPDDTNFKSNIENLAQTKLSELHPSCNMASCNLGTAKWDIFRGTTGFGDEELIYRTAGGYCEDDFGNVYADIRFSIVTGEVLSSHCANYIEPTDPNSLSLNFKGYFFGHGASTSSSPDAVLYEVISPTLLRTYYEQYPDCNVAGTATTEVELSLPQGLIIERLEGNEKIAVKSISGNKAVFEYTINCPEDNTILEVPIDIVISPNQACDLSPNHLIFPGQEYCTHYQICGSNGCRPSYQIYSCGQGAISTLKPTREVLSCDDSTQPIQYEEIPPTCAYNNRVFSVGQDMCYIVGCLAGGAPEYCYSDVYTCTGQNTWEYKEYVRNCDDSTQPITFIQV